MSFNPPGDGSDDRGPPGPGETPKSADPLAFANTQIGPPNIDLPPVPTAAGPAPVEALGMTAAPPPIEPGPAQPKKKRTGVAVLLTILGLAAVAGAALGIYLLYFTKTKPKLAKYVPKDTVVYLEIPDVQGGLTSALDLDYIDADKLNIEKLRTQCGKAIADSFDVSKDDGVALCEGLSSVAFAGRELDENKKKRGDDEADEEKSKKQDENFALLLQFASADPVEKLLGSKRFEKVGKLKDGSVTYKLVKRAEGEERAGSDLEAMAALFSFDSLEVDEDNQHVAWVPGERLLLVGGDPMLEGIAGVVGGDDSLEANEVFQEAREDFVRKSTLFAYFDMSAVKDIDDGKEAAAKFFAKGGAATLSIALSGDGTRTRISVPFSGKNVPDDDLYTPAAELDLAEKLPIDTFAYLAFSTKKSGDGKEARDALLDVAAAVSDEPRKKLESQLEKAEKEAGLGADDLLDALGDQGVLAVVADRDISKRDIDSPDRLLRKGAIVLLLEIGDADAADKLKKRVLSILDDIPQASEHYKVEREDGTDFTLEPKGISRAVLPQIKVKTVGDTLVVVAGTEDHVARAFAAFEDGDGALDDDDAHSTARGNLPDRANLLLWIDTGRVLEVAQEVKGDEIEKVTGEWNLDAIRTTGDDRFTSALALGLDVDDGVWRAWMESVNGAEVLGVAAAFGVYGTQRYLSSAKTSEAKNTVGAISRGAMMSYEREQIGALDEPAVHQLCKSAPAVPSSVPRGVKYSPDAIDGSDFETGDSTSGWKCLRFEMAQPMYYQYEYRQGGPYKGPERGGPDPGPDGFEASAEGDLDGDGKTSLFTRIGRIENGEVKLDTEIFISNEFE